jgi:RNA polymerase sigma factor (sigma-70 family)
MDINENIIRQQFEIAYNFALYKLGNVGQAEDVAAQVINLYILKSDQINTEKVSAWIRGTCLNYCHKFYDQKNREKVLTQNLKEHLITSFATESNDDLATNFRNALENLSELDTRSLVLYFCAGQNLRKMSEITGESYSNLRKRIYRIKQKIKADTYKNLGFIATKKIIVPQLHEAIIQFVRRLKSNIQANTIENMFYYFSETELKNYNPQFDIHTIKDYEVLLKDGVYKIFLFYLDSNNQMNNLAFSFFLNEKKQLKISNLPKQQNKIMKISQNSSAAAELSALLNDYPEDNRGLVKIPPELLKNFITK